MQKSKLQSKIQNYYFQIITTILFLMIFGIMSASAARLEMISMFSEMGVSQQFKVEVYLNTEGEEINAVEAKIQYSDKLILKEWRDGSSIVNLWTEKPNVKNNAVSFSGIIPGGYKGKEGLILTLNFQAVEEVDGTISFIEPRAFLNDGKGTEAEVKIKNIEYKILNIRDIKNAEKELYSKSNIPYSDSVDNAPPEPFTPQIARNNDMFDGKWFLVFNAQDKDSGVSHYEIKELKIWNLKRDSWTKAESPYVLKDQDLNSYIYAKAVDSAGNERIAMLSPQNFVWYENYFILGIIILLAVIIYALIKKKKWR